ncbi:hypothetical protein LEP1GSC039_3856 [Leptospira santarosai str. 2000027870]|nr:hypothetical protein [Leptospira santarosai]EMM88552.1 hypothetical protein LEP1GSC039_3856 [Leptospira santarosai str. 2000027870]
MKIEERNGSRFLCCDYTNGTTIVKVDVFVDLEKLGFSFREPQITVRETFLLRRSCNRVFGEKHS